jgi:tape measure domain-containing protein
MADREASFAVRLIDRVTRPARGITASIRKINAAVKRANGGAAGRTPGSRTSAMHKDLPKPSDFGKGFDAATSAVGGLTLGIAGAIAKATLLAATLAGIGAAFVVKGIVDAAAHAERMRLAFKNLTGSTREGERAFGRASRLAEDLGLNVQDTAEQFAGLLSAGFTQTKAETLVKMTADLKSVGKTAEETKSAIRAITQIKAKGRLQAEELVGQLSEAGVGAERVYEQLEKQTGKTRKQVLALITAGGVDADMGIAAIEAAVLKMTGSDVMGDAGREAGSKLLSGMIDRLKNAPQSLFKRIAEAASTGRIKVMVKQLLNLFESINPSAAARAFERVIDLARTAITLGTEFAKGFGEGFGEITAALQVGSVEDASKRFRELGRDVASIAVALIEISKVLAKVTMAFTTQPGRWALAIFGVTAVLVTFVGWVGKLAALFGATGLAGMGSFGVGLATLKGLVGGLWTLVAGITGSFVAWGSSAAVLAAPFALLAAKLALVAGVAIGAYKAMSALLDITGASKGLEAFGASLAGPEIPRAMQRGLGQTDSMNPALRTFSPKFGSPTQAPVSATPTVASPALQARAGDVSIANMRIDIGGAMAGKTPRQTAHRLASRRVTPWRTTSSSRPGMSYGWARRSCPGSGSSKARPTASCRSRRARVTTAR